MTLSGANTYSGLTTVTAGELDLNTTGNNSIAGNLTVSAGTAKLLRANQIADTATVTVSGTGVLNTGSALTDTIGTLNLSGGSFAGTSTITVAADYTNTGFGSGNSFNRLAGVTGGSSVAKSGNAAQGLAVDGAAATNGNATLALNTHVNQTVNGYYQVTNTGTSGPSIRGAIQTIGTGNITDGRLSGTGVTAGNYNSGNALGLGASTSNLGVTFTPGSSAGALSGQAVQVVDNFGDTQTLSITGAAYNYAVADFQKHSGTGALSGSDTAYTLDFGLLAYNTGIYTTSLKVNNAGPGSVWTDLLNGHYQDITTGKFSGSGITDFSNIQGGSATDVFTISIDTNNAASLGLLTGSLILSPTGHNEGGYSGALSPITLYLTGAVQDNGATNISALDSELPSTAITTLNIGVTDPGRVVSNSGTNTIGTLNVGFSEDGAFNQSGGSTTVGQLNMGVNIGKAGIYNLSSGTLAVASFGENGAGTSTLNLDGGTLSGNWSTMTIDNLNIGTSAPIDFTQEAGKSITLASGLGLGSGSVYNLSAGSLSVKDILMGTGSEFNMQGGTLSLLSGGTIDLGYGGTMFSSSLSDLDMTSGLIKGTGRFTNINLDIGSDVTLSPGNSPGIHTVDGGTETWAGGGTFIWEIANALGTAGTDWDLVRLINDGVLNITATPENKFNLELRYVGPEPFEASGIYDPWLIVDNADGAISGFAPENFNITATGFGSGVTGSQFIVASGSITLGYTSSVPEPSSMAVSGLAIGLLGLIKKMRNKKRA